MIGRKRNTARKAVPAGTETPAVDVTGSLARALRNPLKQPASTVEAESQDLLYTLRAIESSFYLMDRVREVLVEACHLVLRAHAIDDLPGRALLAEQYDEMRHSIERLLESAEEEAATLVGPRAEGIVAKLNATSTYTVSASPLSLEKDGLDLPPPTQGFEQAGEIALILGKLDQALEKLDSVSAGYMKDAQFLMTKLGRDARV